METIELIDKPAGYEYRVAIGDHSWGDWEKVTPRNAYMSTVEDRVREISEYIAAGYKYQLRALYAGPIPDNVLTPSNATSHRGAACGASGGLPGCASNGDTEK